MAAPLLSSFRLLGLQAEFTDAEWFELAEATFQVTLMQLHTNNTLETAAYEMLEPPRGVGGFDSFPSFLLGPAPLSSSSSNR